MRTRLDVEWSFCRVARKCGPVVGPMVRSANFWQTLSHSCLVVGILSGYHVDEISSHDQIARGTGVVTLRANLPLRHSTRHDLVLGSGWLRSVRDAGVSLQNLVVHLTSDPLDLGDRSVYLLAPGPCALPSMGAASFSIELPTSSLPSTSSGGGPASLHAGPAGRPALLQRSPSEDLSHRGASDPLSIFPAYVSARDATSTSACGVPASAHGSLENYASSVSQSVLSRSNSTTFMSDACSSTSRLPVAGPSTLRLPAAGLVSPYTDLAQYFISTNPLCNILTGDVYALYAHLENHGIPSVGLSASEARKAIVYHLITAAYGLINDARRKARNAVARRGSVTDIHGQEIMKLDINSERGAISDRVALGHACSVCARVCRVDAAIGLASRRQDAAPCLPTRHRGLASRRTFPELHSSMRISVKTYLRSCRDASGNKPREKWENLLTIIWPMLPQ
ncbi:hypothetical protein C8R45DRAFT_943352 [Mycena sanguinolenta]|nr:hypothetical protein C8R45DRAFT_943352 [Mycena sanguinolenta]